MTERSCPCQTPPMDALLIGADRIAAVTRLRDIFKAGRPRMAVVVGPPGSGRTFVVEQLFRVFQTRHGNVDECYWPAELEQGKLFPSRFVPGSGSKLTELWLATSSRADHPLHQLADQLNA